MFYRSVKTAIICSIQPAGVSPQAEGPPNGLKTWDNNREHTTDNRENLRPTAIKAILDVNKHGCI